MFNTINADDLSDLLDDLNLAFQSSSHGGELYCHGIRGRCSTSAKRVNAVRAANQRLLCHPNRRFSGLRIAI
jgi:hypothetical protein